MPARGKVQPEFSIGIVIPKQAGIQQNNIPRSGQNIIVDLLCGIFLSTGWE
jgi:hypothetical protein